MHADLLAMVQADERLGWSRRPHPLRLAVNLEPCVMCLGAAMTSGVAEVCFALESPSDGGAWIATGWSPGSADIPGHAAPIVTGSIRREASRDLFRRYCDSAPDSGFRRGARTIVELPG